MKKIKYILLIALLLLLLTGCESLYSSSVGNKQWVDTNYKFDQAIIELPDGRIVTGQVQTWRDFEDGDQLQIKIDGITYLVHSTNAVLIYLGEENGNN